MNCSTCHRILASTLSVCPSCGTMVHDSVREELALKIVPIAKKIISIKTEKSIEYNSVDLSNLNLSKKNPTTEAPKEVSPIISKEHLDKEDVEQNNPIVPKKTETAKIMIKATSPTLVGFQNKNTTLPDWRLKLQNSVRKRLDQQKDAEEIPKGVEKPISQTVRRSMAISGATALKDEPLEEIITAPKVNTTVGNALRRIEASREKYYVKEPIVQEIAKQAVVEQEIVKQFPILPNKSQDIVPTKLDNLNIATAKPNVVQFYDETKASKFDTNKLPSLPEEVVSGFENRPIKKIVLDLDLEDELLELPAVLNRNEKSESIEIDGSIENYVEEDDYAPISLRFNSALFDLLICSFLSLILLSPFMLLNGRFFSIEGFFAFLATCTIVTFIYLTTSIGFLGRTIGMKIFSLEIYDIEGDDYPSLHQAAVSSSVYLFSLAFGGLGFLTMFINQEKRAAHDLLSRTIIIKE